MKRVIVLCALCLLPCTGRLAAQTVSAEPWFRKGTWMLSASMGGAAFTDFQRGTARMADGGTGLPDFQRTVSASTTIAVGGSVTHWLGDNAGVRIGVGYAPTRFNVHHERDAQRRLDELGGFQRERYAKLDVWQGTAAAVFRLPVPLGRVVPYGLVGGGVVHFRMSEDAEVPPEARRRFAQGTWTGPAGVVGIGATLPLQRRNLLMNFELTNHISPTPLDDEGRGESFEMSGVPLQLAGYSARGSDGIGIANQVRLMVGITLPLR